MATKKIPEDVRKQVEAIVDQFNRQTIRNPDNFYIPRYRGAFLYLNRQDILGQPAPICRLKYTSDMNNWEFAIYKYSSERYDPDEWFFPGSGKVDGTIEGAMKAGLEAYP